MGNFYSRRDGEPKYANIVIVAVFIVGMIAAITIAGHFLGWWLVADSTNRQAQVNQQSYGYQQSRQDDLTRLVSTVNTINTQISGVSADQQQALKAQRHAVVDQACAAASQLTTVPAAQTAWVSANCADGAANPNGPNAS